MLLNSYEYKHVKLQNIKLVMMLRIHNFFRNYQFLGFSGTNTGRKNIVFNSPRVKVAGIFVVIVSLKDGTCIHLKRFNLQNQITHVLRACIRVACGSR